MLTARQDGHGLQQLWAGGRGDRGVGGRGGQFPKEATGPGILGN